MKARPTIEDVASKASLSISTVSLVLNNKSNVSDATRRKVRDAITELGYHPHRSARGLASKLTGNIGFILSNDHFSMAEPFYTRIFLGTEFEARDHNYYILLTTVQYRARGKENVPRFLLERNVDGIIIAGRIEEHLIKQFEQFGIPMVLIDFSVPRKRHSVVCIDNEQGARLAVRHLIEGGRRKIAFVGGDIAHPSIAERLASYKQTLLEEGIEVDPRIIDIDEPDTGFQNGYNAAARLARNRELPPAIFAANDAMAIGCMQFLKSIDMRIPDDVAVVGFDDIEMSSHVEPQLTTVRVFKEEMGKLAVVRLVEMMKSGSGAIVTVRVPVQLVVRESSLAQSNAASHAAVMRHSLNVKVK
jgi:LacI family transcriptional regulator